ncbi:MAG: PKD domain-containing protein [Flavobacteriales bacterium]|nr:PKD domain-containing protein [Flavobacteriales bacterium]
MKFGRKNRAKLFVLALLSLSCSLVRAQQTLLFENFDQVKGTKLPAGWKTELLQGNSGTDSFRFSSEQFIPFGLIENGFASFDVYNGGYRGASNGDGSREDITLQLPLLISDSGKSSIEFVYHLVRLRTPSFSLEYRDQGSLTWKEIWADSIGTNAPVRALVHLDDRLKKGSRFELRFRWRTRDIQLTQGYVLLDQVHVYNRLRRDLGIEHHLKTDQRIQLGSSIVPQVIIRNHGQLKMEQVPFVLTVERADKKIIHTFRDTLKALNPGASVLHTLGSIKFSESGKLTVRSMLRSPDDHSGNDTNLITIWVVDSLTRPSTKDAARCGPGSVELNATHASKGVLWEQNDSVLGFGKQFKTPEIGTAQIYYARAYDSFPGQLNSGQGPFRFNGFNTGATFLRVHAVQPVRLEKLAMHFANGNTATIRIYVRKGDYSGSEKDPSSWNLLLVDTVNTGSWGQLTWMDIPDLVLPVGDTLSFCIETRGNASFTFKKDAFESAGPSVVCYSNHVSNAFSASGIVYPGYSWDGAIDYSTHFCSPRVPAKAVVVQKPSGVQISVDPDFFGIVGKGTSTDPDRLAEDGKAVYRINPPNGWSNADYSKNWQKQHFRVSYTGGQTLPDSLFWFIQPGSGKDMQIGIRAVPGLIDSTLKLEMVVEDLVSKCDTFLERFVHISRRPRPKFVHKGHCAGEILSFTNTTLSRDSLNYEWDFGDGYKAFDLHAAHRFSGTGAFRVKLTARNKYGITGLFADTLTIYRMPVASASVVHACKGTAVQIQPTLRDNPASTTYSMYGDGGRLHVEHASGPVQHHFSGTGKFAIRLTANHMGCMDSSILQAYQFPIPVASFNLEENCQYDEFRFENISFIEGNEKLGYQWFRNGQLFSTIKSPSRTEEKSGINEYRLITVSQFNCRDTFTMQKQVLPSPKSRFTASLACNNEPTRFLNESDLPAELTYIYIWKFGDGRESGDSAPTHAYSAVGEHEVSLRITASNGCTSQYDSSLVVRVQPNARFTVGTICSGEEAVFVNYSKTENKILKHKWYFGDGDSSELHSPRHLFETGETRSYRVRLRVYVQDGDCEDVHDEVVVVNRSPLCAFTPVAGSDPLRVSFKATDSLITDYTWSFEGGGISRDAEPSHRFQVSGTYLVRLFARNEANCQCRGEQYVTVGTTSAVYKTLAEGMEFTVYPNPADRTFQVRTDQQGPFGLDLFDITGKCVLRAENVENLQAVDISQFPAGIYRITLSNQHFRAVSPLLIH